MSNYAFRLETLRKLRKVHRDDVRGSLAEAYRAERVLADRRAEIEGEQELLRRQQRELTNQSPLDVNRLAEAQRYELVLRGQLQTLSDQARLLDDEIERRRQQLVQADREVRALDLLDDRHRHDFELAQRRRETKELDEFASIHARRQSSKYR